MTKAWKGWFCIALGAGWGCGARKPALTAALDASSSEDLAFETTLDRTDIGAVRPDIGILDLANPDTRPTDEHPSPDGSSDPTNGPADASDAADTGDSARQWCSSTETVTPVTTIASYSQWTSFCAPPGPYNVAACADADLMQRLLACDAVLMRKMTGYGGETLLVSSRRDATCVLEFWEDFEGVFSFSVCELPLPVSPWSGLRQLPMSLFPRTLLMGIEPYCTEMQRCCLQGAPCAPPYCGANRPIPPICQM